MATDASPRTLLTVDDVALRYKFRRKTRSICRLLINREHGYPHRQDETAFRATAALIADRELVDRHSVTDIKGIAENMRSSFLVLAGSGGLAFSSQTNRCVTVIDSAKKIKVATIKGVPRTVWTIDQHPLDPRYLATGSLNGHVSVFKDFELYSTFCCSELEEDKYPYNKVTSITFHPTTLSILCYSAYTRIVVWNWEQNMLIHQLYTNYEKIKYIKFHPQNQMLITAISCQPVDGVVQKQETFQPKDCSERKVSAYEFLLRLFDVIGLCLKSMELDGRTQFDNRKDANIAWETTLESIMVWEPPKTERQSPNNTNTQHMDDFDLTLKLFALRLQSLRDIYPDLLDLQRSFRILNENCIKIELTKLRQVIRQYHSDTKSSSNRHIIDEKRLSDIFSDVHHLIISQQYTYPIDNDELARIENERIQIWPFPLLDRSYPNLHQVWRNVLTQATVHNDSTIELSKCGKLIASFRRVANGRLKINIHSLEPSSIGERIFSYDNLLCFSITSLSISPSLEYLLVGIRSNRMFSFFIRITGPEWSAPSHHDDPCSVVGYHTRKTVDEVSVMRWMARPGEGAIAGFSSFHLRAIGYGTFSTCHKYFKR